MRNLARSSTHREPVGAREVAQHYLRDLVYGAIDGIITTFAVVAGVAGGALSGRAVLIIGCANLVADGLSMGVGNYLGIRVAGERARRAWPAGRGSAARAARHRHVRGVPRRRLCALDTLLVTASHGLLLSTLFTMLALFTVGSLRSFVTVDRWWMAGLEMLGLGIIVAAAAYGVGALAGAIAG